LTAVAVGVFLFLAQWQLKRAEEKRALLEAYAQRLKAPALVLHGGERLQRDLLRYRQVVVTGVWEGDRSFLLDNRTLDGRVGYEVFTPLKIEGSSWVILINRGWVAAGANRFPLPEVSLPPKKVTIYGMADSFPRPGWYLKGMEIPTDGWPALVEQIVPEVIARRLGQEVMDFQIKLAPEAEDGYIRKWQLDFVNPHRNLGYALQWASFACISLGLWVWHGWQRARKRDEA
jgi:surfeit locus 1 family protein